MEMNLDSPRLSTLFRNHSDLASPHKPNYAANTLDAIRRNRVKFSGVLSWREFVIIASKESKSNRECLQKLGDLAKELTGDDQTQQVIGNTAMFLLNLFLEQPQVNVGHYNQLKLMFGTVTSELVKSIHKVVNSLSNSLSSECLDLVKALSNEAPQKLPKLAEEDVVFSPKPPDPPDLSYLQPIVSSATVDCLESFSMAYNGEPSTSNNNKQTNYGRAWLVEEIKSSFKGTTSANDMCETVVALLTSQRSNDELQNELFDLVGFDHFELIQTLLMHRSDIVQSCSAAEEKKMMMSNARSSALERRPAFGCQVVVQSEQEKLLQKQARKEEKKINKWLAKEEEVEEEEVFDPVELRAKRQAALKNPPIIFTSSSNKDRIVARASQPKEVYPHVYDSMATVRQNAGFISGLKLMLPEGALKKDTRQYEEVNIPACEAAPTAVGSNFIPINTLDEIGQMVFEGMKHLNRIQSVVFETAYHSNENLLICAPTGAGKTNVALLAILHTIGNYSHNKVIRREQFKIVYVAPMKALAAEMTASFSRRLKPLGVIVRELTGDMQLTKTEIMQTQMLVTTPEKWDVVTRKAGDVALANLVKLLIIDEVHLLHSDRGPVVEAIVARTLRQVESSQNMIRIVGLSATLPTYLDVSRFLRVNPYKGLFYFDGRFRPVPLHQTFIGIKALKPLQQMNDMDQVCYEKVHDMVAKGHQVMVFVHARNATVRTANVLREMAQLKGQLKDFEPGESSAAGLAYKAFSRCRSKQLAELFQAGFSVHHAGLLRSDRSLVEKYFGENLIKVLVCTSTLAWGVNLPAHAVIIRGTEIYDAKKGSFVDLEILDVLQIFGRAGRPQFDKSGHGTIITTHDKLSHYLSTLTNQYHIESNFISCLVDNLNAEVTLGTISNVDEAVKWLSYTYLHVRMRMNPLHYGISHQQLLEDPNLDIKQRELIENAAQALDKAKMLRFNPRTGDLSVTDLGRTASHYYIKYDTVEVFNEDMNMTSDCVMDDKAIFAMISKAQEFEQLKVRDDELDELDNLTRDYCEVEVMGGSENLHGKVNILLQTYLSRGRVNSFSLLSDLSYITQNAVRIARALFDIMLRKQNPLMAGRFLQVCLEFERRQWFFESEMRQFTILGQDIIDKIERNNLCVFDLRDMDAKAIGVILRHAKMGETVKRCASEFPLVEIDASLHPITRTILRIRLTITADFKWNDRVHGKTSEAFWVWIEDPLNNYMYHSEYFLLTRKQVIQQEPQELVITIPISEPLPPQYIIRVSSDTWLSSVNTIPLTFQHLILPETHPPHTDLLELQPLPVTALGDTQLELLYPFTHFNPIQTQIFHCLYHTDNNVLLGAPTGSGKTIAAEIAMFRVFKQYPGSKVVYIAPLKALVRERIEDWKVRLTQKLNRSVVELTGDVTPDARAIASADVIVTTPEKWDGISRSWQTRGYVRAVALIIIDEIHLLGEDRGPVLEVIVSRTNFIASHTSKTLRIVGLSTALANAKDLANWLGIGQMGLYNFRPSVRPVPLEVHISSFPGKHYCPRMATMNRPTFQAIRQYSPAKPALIFVSSRRQTRLTALDLIAFLAAEDDPKQWLHMDENEMEQIVGGVKDSNLKLTLAFGIGMHHAGLVERDRKTVEELFVNQKIQVLIATATLAWGVNFPAHLVVVKGTEYYDGKSRRYVDMPITDVLQMMGRAGRPQFDQEGVAVVLVHDMKKNFYKKFIYEPFPVESSLLTVLADHLNAEIVAGTIKTRQEALDYLTWTYFFRRLLRNPTYYGLESVEEFDINKFLSTLIEKSLATLEDAQCIMLNDDGRGVSTTSLGRIASFYYLSHETMLHLRQNLSGLLTQEELLKCLCHVHEYSQLPVRHNEDMLNGDLAKICPIAVDQMSLDSPHTKAHLLLQAHFSHLQLPCTDYYTDTKSVLDQSIRILQAMVDVCAEQGWLATTLRLQLLMQMVSQARWLHDSPITTLPHVEPHQLYVFRKYQAMSSLPSLMTLPYNKVADELRQEFDEGQIEQIYKVLQNLPKLKIELSVQGWWEESGGDVKHVRPGTNHPLVVHSNEDYTLCVKLTRLNRSKERRAHAPRFPKPKDEGWFLTLGHVDSVELLALKRVPPVHHSSNQMIAFSTPDKPGRYMMTLYVFSDTYLGLDQQFDILLDLVPSTAVREPVAAVDDSDQD
ncbi:activating signal cointegrator 1 complex subunit 3 [Macrosteles quadrilineatus]|uniref:activating signal cointegrator 1 complex subunit 3 n=1 Tax=Macrosteles quadrilineatus TaxID=74068 RepID=UPI0023E20F83|nr:activating signal cointegrator 1 complex subunit 3 [Macrosteles quadrilineatus]XP_054270396.1 activating signal cointegrator 1 complex subunit 3 [Macrosteles quadrilineatus]